ATAKLRKVCRATQCQGTSHERRFLVQTVSQQCRRASHRHESFRPSIRQHLSMEPPLESRPPKARRLLVHGRSSACCNFEPTAVLRPAHPAMRPGSNDHAPSDDNCLMTNGLQPAEVRLGY